MCLACLLQEGIAARTDAVGTAAPVAARALILPCDFAGYRLVREVASGGMGIVYEAQDLKLRRVVALKVIRNAVFASREEAARFKAETQAVAQLDHSDIVPIYESGEEDGMPFYTMRLAEGGSLADRLKKRGILPDREAAELMLQIANAVQHAHEHGVLHRDLKPANILLDVTGRPMLSDFGLAKVLDAEFQLTRTQAHIGTPHYMSPEQAAGRAKQVTTASDVWALGVMLYQMLTDKLPFQGDSAVEVMRRITEEEPEISSTGKLVSRSRSGTSEVKTTRRAELVQGQVSHIQQDLATLILRCLEKQPTRRLRSAEFLAEELQRFLTGQPILSRAVGPRERVWKWVKRNKGTAAAIIGISFSLVGGTIISTLQTVKARQAERQALQQKADSDEMADIILETAKGLDEHVIGHEVDSDHFRTELLNRISQFRGKPERKAMLLGNVSTMLKRAEDLRLFRELLQQVEPQLPPDSALLWSIRYRAALKALQFADDDGLSADEAQAELRRVLQWQRSSLPPEDAMIYKTQFALADSLIRQEENTDALREAESLLRSCLSHYERQRDPFDIIVCRIELMTALFTLGYRAEALGFGRTTVDLSLREFGEDHSISARVLGRLARHCKDAGLIDEAITHGRRSVAIYWRTVGPSYVKASATLDALAANLGRKGDRQGVLKLRQEALRECDQRLGPMDAVTQRQAGKVARALLALERSAEALELMEEWLERVKVDGHVPASAMRLLYYRAEALQKLGRQNEAGAVRLQLPKLVDAAVLKNTAFCQDWISLVEDLLEDQHNQASSQVLLRLISHLREAEVMHRDVARLLPRCEELLRKAQANEKQALHSTSAGAET